MTAPSPPPPLSRMRSMRAATRARERDVCIFYPCSLDIPDLSSALAASPHTLPPAGYRPRHSPDSVLTSITQLAALRLRTARALVSLIDGRSQIILAEATPTLSLRCDASPAAADTLWLGSVIIPRSCSVCEMVLDAEPGKAVVINDLQHDARFQARSFVQNAPYHRFYAGVPLVAETGSVVGSLCVFDDRPRDSLDPGSLSLLQDIAAAAMSYLNVLRAREDSRHAEQMMHGLASFVASGSKLQGHSESDVPRSPNIPTAAPPLPAAARLPPLEQSAVATVFKADDGLPAQHVQLIEEQAHSRAKDQSSLHDTILPSGAKCMFSRAAKIMRESSDLTGVIIFDASTANSIGSTGSSPFSAAGCNANNLPTMAASDSGSSESEDTAASSKPALCKILGFADTERSSYAGNSPQRDYLTLTESNLKRLLAQNPQGKVFHIPPLTGNPSPSISPDSEDETSMRRIKKLRSSTLAAIVDIAQGARSAAVIPLWDFQRERWFAGCLCWTIDPKRLLSYDTDLLHLRTFGNSIMAELSRLDALAVDKAKTTFIESISHELRSPLHGILGGVEYLQGMQMDSFQTNIVISIGMCGRTLLDTITNVLEYSKINEFADYSTKAAASPTGQTLHPPTPPSPTPTIDLCQLTEETVEAVFSGHSYNILSTWSEESGDLFLHLGPQNMSNSPTGSTARKPLRLILDTPKHRPWLFAIQPGIWRCIVMNVFGNAIKYTEAGYIRIKLSAVDLSDVEAKISLTVTDSSIGISGKYLQEDLFKPFSQENPFTTGVGLGLSIVRRLVDSLGGDIKVQSQVNVGTEVCVTITLLKRTSLSKDLISTVAAHIKGRQVLIPTGSFVDTPKSLDHAAQSEYTFIASIAATLEEWFEVHVATAADAEPDWDQLVIYLGPRSDYMSRRRPHRGMSVVIALDAIEAATLRTDPRIVEGCVEVITQPCGPSKLAKVLRRYLNHLETESLELVQSLWPSVPPGNQKPSIEATPSLPPLPSTLTRPSPLPQILGPPLPRKSGRISPQTSSPSHSPSPQRQRRRDEILIVDDNTLNLRLLSAFLTKHGFLHHTSAQNGLEAVNLFKADPRRWAAVLMDLSMPVMDGITATREIREWERNCMGKHEARVEEALWSELGGTEEEEQLEANSTDRAATGRVAEPAIIAEGRGKSATSHFTALNTRRARAESGVQIVVITGLGSATARYEAVNAGADAFMTKPVRFSALMKMLKERIEGSATAVSKPPSVASSVAASVLGDELNGATDVEVGPSTSRTGFLEGLDQTHDYSEAEKCNEGIRS